MKELQFRKLLALTNARLQGQTVALEKHWVISKVLKSPHWYCLRQLLALILSRYAPAQVWQEYPSLCK